MAQTTKRDFEIFEHEVRRLTKLWGLTDWDLRMRHGGTDALAECYPRGVMHIATVRLGKSWGTDLITPTSLREAARHETAHLATGELVTMARARCVTEDELTAAIELTARRLERLLPR